MDSLLRPYLEAADDGDAEQVLGDIVTNHAAPVVRSIVRSKLRGSPDASDVESGAIVELIGRIRAIRTRTNAEPIEDLSGYAAKTAYNSCSSYFRTRVPHEAVHEGTSNDPLDPHRITESRIFAERLWEEIRLLPVNQRVALLLNMKDNAIMLFPLCGVASIRQIAAALEMPAEKVALLWNNLPMDDNALAALLDLSRQQVINLRMSARKRLANRLQAWR
jgi:RNA polymerase sigma factor (sigma-70 family)